MLVISSPCLNLIIKMFKSVSKVCSPLLDQLDLPAICNWAEVDGEEDDVRQQRRDDLVPDLQKSRNEKKGRRLDIFVFF